ncbi:hypothetical protein ACPXCS_02865 [Streptomyces sp. DT190]|uniref:hypothetical protein n=1 Tax=unclassified Streptomyces TaxID=2593676 RepID=UPI003CF456F7
MLSEVLEFRRACRDLSDWRRICAGEALLPPDEQSWPNAVRTEAEFDALVSAAYKLWRESWKLDIGFLLAQRGNDRPARQFDELVYHLRTASQHTDNSDSVARRSVWISEACGGRMPEGVEDWERCGRSLMTEISAAIACLTKLASAGRNNRTFRQAWQAKVSESVPSIVAQVADDLGLRLSERSQAYHVREVDRQWSRYRLRRGETASVVIASLAERSLVGKVDALPCNYDLVLDELRILGTAHAAPALRLAHAVAEISGAKGETYLKQVKTIWASLRMGTLA